VRRVRRSCLLHLRNSGAVSEEEGGLLGACALGVSGDGLEHAENGGLALGLHGLTKGLAAEAGALRGVVAELGKAALLERANASGAVLCGPFTGRAHIPHTAGLHAAP
jgi:hypothetical protein